MGVINIFTAPKEYPKLQSLFFFFQFLLKLGSRPTIFVAFSCFQLFHECLKCFFQCIHQEIQLFDGSKRGPYIRNFSDFCHKGQQSLLEIWFSVFCNSFMSVWGACSITCRETFSIILASKGIHKFAIFVYIFLNLSGKHQLWPHRTPTTSWKFGFLFFGESSGEFKVVIYSLIWTNYWL